MGFINQIFRQFSDDRCSTLAASLSYYTVFALPPLLYLLVMILTAGLSINYDGPQAEEHARDLVKRQVEQLLGNQSASDAVTSVLQSAREDEGKWWRSLLSFAAILLGATGVVAALQDSLNQVWKVKVESRNTELLIFMKQRILSLAMILGLGFLLLVSLVVSTVATAFSQRLDRLLGVEGIVVEVMNYFVQAGMIFFVIGAILRYMPAAIVHWRQVAIGSATTTVLFLVGRILIQLYFSYSPPGQGLASAAASLMAVLVWVFYSSLILLLGAEITHILSESANADLPKRIQGHG